MNARLFVVARASWTFGLDCGGEANTFSCHFFHMKTLALPLLIAASLTAPALLAQAPAPKLDFPVSSPPATLKQRVGLTDIEVTYARPGVKGRKVFGPGGLEPYGTVWRTGADSPTKITFSTPVTFGGKPVPAGSYGLYSIPGDKEWTVIVNKVGEKDWGAYNYSDKNDVARVTVKPVALAQRVETFEIDISDIATQSANLNLSWDKVRVPVKIEVDVVGTLKPQLDQVMASNAEKKPYFRAAMFYFESGLDLKQALEWMDAGLKEQPNAFWMIYRKGLILEKMGNKAGAREAAQASRALADKEQRAGLREEYLRLNDMLLARLK